MFISCNDVVKKSQEIIIGNQKPPLEGKYFPLDSDNIKLFLPKEFKKLSKDEYLAIIEKENDSIVSLSERERLHKIKKSGWDIYFFEYLESSSILSVIPIEYVKFNRNDAQMLLNQIKYDMDQSTESTGNEFTKVEARFFETKEAQIFKAIYNVENKKDNLNFFREIYFVSFNKKSFVLSLDAPVLVDFDPYLDKIRVL
jgi:hypothetical protein